MFPLALVSQGRYEIYTIVSIDESRLTSLSLYDHFVTKVGRVPKTDEKIKFVVQPGVDLIGSLDNYTDIAKSSALYIRKTDFLPSNTLALENRGSVLGRGGEGRTQGTFHFNFVLDSNRHYGSAVFDKSEGGNAIINESDIVLTVINHGLLASGGSGGGALGGDALATGAYGELTPDKWRLRYTHGPGGGGAPYGKGGFEDHRAEDFMSGNYIDPIPDQAKVVSAVPIVRSQPAVLRRMLDNTIIVMDAWDTQSTQYSIPLTNNPDNWLPIGLTLYFRLKSPPNSTHYNMYKSEIEGPDKDRIIFQKTYYPLFNGGSKYSLSESIYAISAPVYLGENASLLTPGKAGFTYTEHITGRTGFAKGYVAARGGKGGAVGRRGEYATFHEDLIMFKPSGAGYITRTLKSVQEDLGLPVSSTSIYATGNLLPGNPGYLSKGNVIISNETGGTTVGRIDVMNTKLPLSKFGYIAGLKQFKITPNTDDILHVAVENIIMTDSVSNHAPITITNFEIDDLSLGNGTVNSMTIDVNTQTPVGDYDYIVINEYGVHPTVTLAAGKITIGDIYHQLGPLSAASTLEPIGLVLVFADTATITKIRDHVNAMNLYGADWYGRTVITTI